MSFEIGEITGDYEIVSVLGAGGMGKVYKVRNTLSDRLDAMKVLLPDLTHDTELADRFLREIKVQARLNHPNIASLHTALHVDNQLLMIMELVDGNNLEQEISRGPVLYQDAESYLIQVLSALDYAHKNGVIHRDIKPANIILMPSGQVKLMDFGIARVAADRSLTKTGIALGTLFYLSPEQIQGDRPDARSDIYALGITFYEVLTGRRPIEGDSDYSIMTAHLEHIPQNPSELNPMVPPALAAVILKSLAKSPDDRFQTAEEFLAAVIEAKRNPKVTQHLQQEAPTERRAVPAKAVTRSASVSVVAPASVVAPQKRRRTVWVAAAAAVLLAGLGIAKFSVNLSPSNPPPATSQQPAAPTSTAGPSAVPNLSVKQEVAPAAIQPVSTHEVREEKPTPPAPRLSAPSAVVLTSASAKVVTNHAANLQPGAASGLTGQAEHQVQSQPHPQQSAVLPSQSTAPLVVPPAPVSKDPRAIMQEDWDRVSSSKDISALQEFQRKHPDSPYAGQAASRIELHSWELVAGSKDANALRAFRTQFPNGPHAAQAGAELEALDSDANTRAVLGVLAAYRAAYDNRDTAAIQSLWPTLGREDLAKIDGFFKATRSAKMVLQPVSQTKFAGDTATIACVRSVTVQMKDGTRQRPIDQNVTVRLKKSGATWVLTALE